MADAVIVGGGMCGLVAWFALLRTGIGNIRIIVRNPPKQDGPWVTSALMETLRLPKTRTGPAAGLPSLTFQAKYRWQDAWNAQDKIPRPMWMDYLSWYRHVPQIRVENDVMLDRVEPEYGLLRLDLTGAAGGSILTRKLVMTTGRDGTGAPLDSRLYCGPAVADRVQRGCLGHPCVVHCLYPAARGGIAGSVAISLSQVQLYLPDPAARPHRLAWPCLLVR